VRYNNILNADIIARGGKEKKRKRKEGRKRMKKKRGKFPLQELIAYDGAKEKM
jgi:hypothetical protein